MINSWKTMPIGKYAEMYKIISSSEDEDTKVLRVAALCNDLTFDEVLNLPMDKASELVANVAFVYTAPEKVKPKKEYVLNGRTYRVIKNYGEITTAQYINYQSIVTVLNENLPEFLSIFFVPKGKKYGDYDTDEVVEDIKTALSVEEALSLSAFFLKRWERSTMRTLFYCEAEIATQRLTASKEKKAALKQMEEGMKNLRLSIKGMFGTQC